MGSFDVHTFMQHVLRPTRERAVIDRAYNLSPGCPSGNGRFQISKDPTTEPCIYRLVFTPTRLQ